MEIKLTNGTVIEVDSATPAYVNVITTDPENIQSLFVMASNSEMDDFTIVGEDGSEISTNTKFDMIAGRVGDGGTYIITISFVEISIEDELRQRIAELETRNQELKDYADAGKIMLGEEVE